MQSIQQALIDFFEKVAQKNASHLAHIKQEENFSFDHHHWCFTLPSLHAHLQQQDDAFSDIDYRQFRQLIYKSPINQAVKTHGAEITIAENRKQVDLSTYSMTWQSDIKETTRV